MKDLCITCGKQVPAELWGGKCELEHKVVHQLLCDVCGRICGILIDDDYCGLDNLFCPDCMDKIRLGGV